MINEIKEQMNPLSDPMDTGNAALPVVTEQDKESFYKTFLSDKPYTEVAPLLGGKFNIKFTSLTVEENNDVLAQIGIDMQLGEAKQNDSYFVQILMFRLGLSIVTINGVPFQNELTKLAFPLDKQTGAFYIRERIKVFNNWQSIKLSAVVDAFRLFEKKYQHLTKEVNNESFWKAAE